MYRKSQTGIYIHICDLPRENRPGNDCGNPRFKIFNRCNQLQPAFARVRPTISGKTGHSGLLAFL